MADRTPVELGGPSYFDDPYPTLNRLRETDPVHWNASLGRWVLTRYEDAVEVLRRADRFSSAVIPQLAARDREPELEDFTRLSARWLFFLDPPRHRADRAPIARWFTPRSVAGLRALIEETADDLLDRPPPEGGMDLVADYTFPMAARSLAGLLCAAPDDRDELIARLRAIEAASRDPRDPAARRRGFECIVEVTASFRRLACDPGGPPLSPLLDHLLGAARRGPGDAEGACLLALALLFAGIETTQNLIGNAALALLRHPGRWHALASESRLLGAAIEECLRHDPPVQGVVRRATEDTVLRGRRLRAGDEVLVLLAAANRDPGHFPDPDAFDIRRPENPHLGFGLGVHYCLGAALARLVTRVALAALLRRWPELRLATDRIEWRDHDPLVRGVRGLLVTT